ncbi:MAG TPA: hypothetical protein VID30_00825 [Bradyrhizobium sp.]|jgi:hypothetical protein
MSTQGEESPIDNPLEALRALTRDRVEPRLAAVSGTPAARAPKLDTPRPPAVLAGDRLENAMSEFIRRQIRPEAVPEPAGLKRERTRSMLSAAAMGLAAAIAVACVVALLYVTVFPREKDAVQSFAAAAPPAASLTRPADAATSGPSQFRALVAANGQDQNVDHEQSERLLQQFVQWRQKAALADKP